jgi:hypothetical protein
MHGTTTRDGGFEGEGSVFVGKMGPAFEDREPTAESIIDGVVGRIRSGRESLRQAGGSFEKLLSREGQIGTLDVILESVENVDVIISPLSEKIDTKEMNRLVAKIRTNCKRLKEYLPRFTGRNLDSSTQAKVVESLGVYRVQITAGLNLVIEQLETFKTQI